MNFLGMGSMEILLVLLLAFIFLGPERMVDAAKLLGKVVGEARRMSSDLPALLLDEDDSASTPTTPGSPAPRAGSASSPASDIPAPAPRSGDASSTAPDKPAADATASQSGEAPVSEDSPVAYRPARGARDTDAAESPEGHGPR